MGIRADQHPNVGASRCPRAGNCRRRTGGVSVGAQRRTLLAAAAAARCHIPPPLLRRTAAPAVRLLEVQCYACEQARRSLRVPPLLRLANQRCARARRLRRGSSTCGPPGRWQQSGVGAATAGCRPSGKRRDHPGSRLLGRKNDSDACSPERCDGSLSGDASTLPAERRSAFPHRACSHEHRGQRFRGP